MVAILLRTVGNKDERTDERCITEAEDLRSSETAICTIPAVSAKIAYLLHPCSGSVESG